ncbi:MAG: hypothetical protein V7K71_22235 [Nostoc sp.]|uniref:hypothetical protein n=1 Tax=Nostoc sp. TaxID=1180 RepID=UPI002FF629F4
MMEINDNDIDDIRNDISMLKNSIDTLSLAFNKHIQKHLNDSSAIHNDNVNITELDNNEVQTDVSITNNLNINIQQNDTFNIDNQSELERKKHNLIDYSFIDKKNNKLLIDIISANNRNMSSCYQSDFLKFCGHSVSLVEEVIKIFLEKKFINIESDNDKLLEACDLLEKEYLENKPKTFIFPKIYIPKKQYNPYKGNTDDYYYYSSKESYLSLMKLKETDIIFMLELCFVTLYGNDFYKFNYRRPRSVNLQTSSTVLRRPPTKLASSLQPLNKEFYYVIDHARDFRNAIVHNENNREEQKKRIQGLLSKKPYLKNIENNYDGIVEAITWFIHQVYFAMK